MGYYVEVTDGAVLFCNEVQAEVLRIWHDLNKPENNHLKRGGRFGPGGQTAHWYSWMPENYHETLLSVEDVLDKLGFTTSDDANGDVWATGYSSKRGQEDLFFDRVSHLITGYFRWVGEDDEVFTWRFDGGVAGLPEMKALSEAG